LSKTIVDMPKVAQMLDSGWEVELSKNRINSYTAKAFNGNRAVWVRARQKCIEAMMANGIDEVTAIGMHGSSFISRGNQVVTDDFTPEQALTRLAYKVHGEIL
jgi:hypothetical protein